MSLLRIVQLGVREEVLTLIRKLTKELEDDGRFVSTNMHDLLTFQCQLNVIMDNYVKFLKENNSE